MAVHRNRVIYQSEALFISPDATGYHFTGAKTSVPEVGDGPFGLMTPPVSLLQGFGGTIAAPAKNSAGQLVGWQAGDSWPEWCPSGDPAKKAEFNGQADIDNATETYTITADQVGVGGNIAAVNGDGTTSLTTLVANAAGPGITYAIAGNGALVPDNASTFSLAGGADHTDASNVFSTITVTVDSDITSATGGTDGNAFTITYNDTVGGQIGAVLNGSDLTVTYDSSNSDTDADVAAAIDAVAGFSSPVIAVPAALAADGAVQENFAGGADGAFASFNGNLPVEVKKLDVHVRAVDLGVAANGITFTGDDVQDIDTFVAAHNAVAGNAQLEVVVGGSHILDSGKTITLGGGSDGCAQAHGTIIKQLKRVQSANYGFTVNRQDVNQFGHSARLDSIIVESPTVNLDFSYYLLDGYNERMLEFVTDATTNTLSGMLTPELYQAGNNFFIMTTPEARDAVGGDVNLNEDNQENSKSVISLGNGYVTDYSVDISVGSIPTASVTVEGMNIKSDFGTTGNDLPSVDMRNGSAISRAWEDGVKGNAYDGGCTGLFSLPAADKAYTGCNGEDKDVAALRPGDVVLDLGNSSLLSKSVEGNGNVPVVGSSHVQSVSVSVPLGRTTLQRLGSTFGFSKALDLPLSVTMNVNALVADMKEGNMLDLLCDCETLDVGVTVYDPECNGCTTKDGQIAMKYELKGARLESENFSSSIGDNKSVDLVFTAQVGGADDMKNGLYISGKEASSNPNGGKPPAWTGIGGQTTGAASGYLFGYRA